MSYGTDLKAMTALPLNFAAAGLVVAVSMGAQANPQASKSGQNPAARPATHVQLAAMCNPCSAEGCNPCARTNPCAPKNSCAANPYAAKNPNGANPCAAKGCNPCAARNPCAASGRNPCNPCNPCGAAVGVEITDDQAAQAYACVKAKLTAAYGDAAYLSWKSYNTVPYVSGTHGSRYVNNYANRKALKYGRYEDAGKMAVGSVLAKDSFVVMPDGKVAIGPLFLMEKMQKGFAPDGGDWRYTMIVPGSGTMGVTGGKNSAAVQFCADCHAAAGELDYLFFLPEDYRK